MKAFLIDISRCTGCYNCQIACKDEHCGNDWSPYAKPQPDTGQFWLKVTEEEKGTIPKVRVVYRPLLCMHCDTAPCITSCPTKGAIYKRADGLVIIDPQKCSGCMNCVHACPYNAIYYNNSLRLAQKCTGCAHLLDKGWKEPRCVDICPTGALKYVEQTEIDNLKGKVEVINPEFGTRPRVYYLNMPKIFVAGLVYDPLIKKVVEGAECILRGKDQNFRVTTDGFGDFWFENLSADTYSLEITASGYSTKTINNISADKDVNLGDIPLNKEIKCQKK
jgi:tetrathionate reductase subunit B